MDSESDQVRPITARCEHGTQHVRQVDTGEPHPLAPCHHRRERHRGDEAPQQPAPPVHTRASFAPDTSRLGGTPWCTGASPWIRLVSESAALINPTWVKAWGKFPSAAPSAGSISSANSPTSLP